MASEAQATLVACHCQGRHSVWRLLDERDISQDELARLCGVSSGYMSQLVGGTRSPLAQVGRRIQQALGITDFDELFIIERVDD